MTQRINKMYTVLLNVLDMIKDDMIFKPYPTMGGWQCIMETKRGRISVRLGGKSLFAKKDKPYEVWYPTEYAPIGEQTAEDIWKYVGCKNVL